MCLICGAFRTSPVNALEIEASIPPIRLALDEGNRRAAIRFNKLSTDSPIAPPIRPPLPVRPANNNAADKRKNTQLGRLALHTSPKDERIFPFLTEPWRRTAASFNGRVQISGSGGQEKKEAAKAHKTKICMLADSPQHLLLYTNGSLRKLRRLRRVGAGVAVYRGDAEIFASSSGLGGHADVYEGELAAMYFGARKAVALAELDRSIKHLHFFADNTSAISTIFDPKPRSELYTD
ncbi:hypothetical protein B0H13DRAFT_1851413 [Mycena leptocephala]|nr:hypothetical protein B0H13DRAFT_1851413 [Mycena leptocephala]